MATQCIHAGHCLQCIIGSAVAGNDEEQLSSALEEQLPSNMIPSDTLPSEITQQYAVDAQQWQGVNAELTGSADLNLHVTLDDKRTVLSAETSRNTFRNINVNTGSAVEARKGL